MKLSASYHRFTLAEREEISRGLSNNESFKTIGNRVSKDQSAISREVNRAGMERYTYRAHKAHWHAQRQKRRQGSKKRIDRNQGLREYILKKLKLRWSPEQIAKALNHDYPEDMTMRISYPAIYTYLYLLPRGSLKKELLLYLRQQKKYRRKRGKKPAMAEELRGQIPEMISIEERPKEVADRTMPGHWEGDILLGQWKQSALGTIVERTSRTVILVPLTNKDAPSVRRAFAREMQSLPKQMKLSLTYDQGKEMSEHKLFTKQTKIQVYFAHPGQPWERGTNENTNGLIRQFFPKGTNFSKITKREIKKVQDLLNGRPRKVLNWRKPYEVFNELVALDS